MFNKTGILLQKASISLSTFLDKILPQILIDWWEEGVVKNLSYQQRQRLTYQNIKSLSSLDFAALLRVFDQNWYQISMKLNLAREDRHFLKEMQTVRNRWAHAGADGFSNEDLYCDLDTLLRFAKIMNAEDNLLQEIQEEKHSLLIKNQPVQSQENPESSLNGNDLRIEFKPGDMIALKSNSSIHGVITSSIPGSPENRFQVFSNGELQTYYASQLLPADQDQQEVQIITCERFHAFLSALQIRYPGLSTLYSLNSARIEFIPYQFRPVLKFIRSERPRLLIADSVGVGKTIEAGLILRELQARRDIRSVLIICPRPLVVENKWRNEMKRFEERFEHLDSGNLQYCINEMNLDGEWPEKYRKIIVPYSLLDEGLLNGPDPRGRRKAKKQKGLLDLDPPPRFDLVIVDEAHYIRNTETIRHKVVRFFCEHAEAVVFLTATPIQLGSLDLFVLLNLLRPDLIIDQESYGHMAEPNRFISQVAKLARAIERGWESQAVSSLDEAAATAWGRSILQNNPDFIRIRSRLAKGSVTDDERIRMIMEIESMNTFSGIINRTRRCDIGDFAVRKPETVVVEFTPAQKSLHDTILKVQSDIFTMLHGNIPVKFMMTTIRRQAASCLFGLIPFLEAILNRHLDELEWAEADSTQPAPGLDLIGDISSAIRSILEQARTLEPVDPKLDALLKIIRDKQDLPNNKLMVFSSFRHTLGYLYEHLKTAGIRVEMVHGHTPDENRAGFRERFTAPRDRDDALDVLLFSEIGSEGLDYQFCDGIVNYDLPWNPMRIEQRIGRIDRKGQKSEAVAIYNLITPGTVDADIYERCLVRIGVFEHSLGECEEILGEITTEIRNIAENLSLSDAERREKLQQMADNKIRKIQEEERLERKQMELFGIRLALDRMKQEVDDATSFWLTPGSLLKLVDLYLHQVIGKDQEFILGEKPLKTMRLSEEARRRLLTDLQKLSRQNTPAYRQWENWLKGGEQYLSITFESECAADHPEAAFITPVHPLIRQAAIAVEQEKRVVTVLRATDAEAPAGNHLFVMYQWQYHGIREDLVLQPVTMDDALTARLPRLIERAEDAGEDGEDIPDLTGWDSLEARHYKMWSEAREKHIQQTLEMAKYRRESLTISHKARIALLEEQLRQAGNEKILKMRQGQIANAQADYSRRLQELDTAMDRADITAGPVAYGIIYIEGGARGEKQLQTD